MLAAYSAMKTPTIACVAAHVHFAITGKLAFEKAQTVVSFNVAFLDHVHAMNAVIVMEYADIQLIN